MSGHDPELANGYQDADLETLELTEAGDEYELVIDRCEHGNPTAYVCPDCEQHPRVAKKVIGYPPEAFTR